ncbi:MAG: peroxide stress protein YaaA [Methylococcales bacterium]|nr:peroxide stress protein YaaA [Methylococcales bacterium]
MIIILSPSKSQDFSAHHHTHFSLPRQLDKSTELITMLAQYSPEALGKLMNISDKLSLLNWHRFQAFNPPFSQDNAKQALLTFTGDVYKAIQINDYSTDDFNFAQQHLRILSGLYGVLRPLDLIQAYRLEMGTRLQNSMGKNLYAFWGTQLTECLNQDFKHQTPLLINLASNEYFKVIKPTFLQAKILTLTFKENKAGIYKVVAIYAKQARGLMANYIIKNRLTDPQKLKAFNLEHYCFNPGLSNNDEWVFSR